MLKSFAEERKTERAEAKAEKEKERAEARVEKDKAEARVENDKAEAKAYLRNVCIFLYVRIPFCVIYRFIRHLFYPISRL